MPFSLTVLDPRAGVVAQFVVGGWIYHQDVVSYSSLAEAQRLWASCSHPSASTPTVVAQLGTLAFYIDPRVDRIADGCSPGPTISCSSSQFLLQRHSCPVFDVIHPCSLQPAFSSGSSLPGAVPSMISYLSPGKDLLSL